MQIRVENKAWVVIILFILALLLGIGLSLSLFAQAQQDISAQRLIQFKLEAHLLTNHLSQTKDNLSVDVIKDILNRDGISGFAEIWSANGKLLYSANSSDRAKLQLGFSPNQLGNKGTVVPGDGKISIYSQRGYYIAQSNLDESNILLLIQPVSINSSRYTIYIFSYQIIAFVFGLFFIYLLIRWLLSPYRRMVKAAQGSPVHANTGKSESEFVVETFQALIDQLQTKEAELEHLHAIEKSRAEKSERFSERVIANLPSGLVAVDSQGLITSLNGYGKSLMTIDDTNGQARKTGNIEYTDASLSYHKFFQTAPRIISMITECLSSGKSYRREEVEIAPVDGRLRKLGLSISPIVDVQQHIEGALCMMTDITEVMELRERIKLQETMANLGTMAAGLAHEFKNSLATIQGYAQLLDSQFETLTVPEEAYKTNSSLARLGLLKEVNLLSHLVTDFLNYARPQQLNLGDVDLQVVLHSCIEELQQQLIAEKIDIVMKGSFVTISADESLIRRVFVNLLRNAMEAIDSEAKQRQITISGYVDMGTANLYAHIKIGDTGVGIPPEYLSKIFIPFFTTKSRGYGIGLAIVQKIILAHNGSVSVERSDATGTIFHCRLPLVTSVDLNQSTEEFALVNNLGTEITKD